MGRKVLAVVVALITAWGIILIDKMIASGMWSTPNNMEYMSRSELAAYFSSRPLEANIVLLIGSVIAAFFGGYIVTNMSRRESPGLSLSLVVAVALIFTGFLNFFVLLPGQPAWLMAATLLSYIPVTLLGHWLTRDTGVHHEFHAAT
ncbi:hypothetical protein BH10ACI2_BH10ACI2_02640 [soil metagenome]